MAQYGVSYIDFLSIDVEGGEWEVLKSIRPDLLKKKVSLICIELDGHNPEKDLRCRKYLHSLGFTRLIRLGLNEFYQSEQGFRDVFWEPFPSKQHALDVLKTAKYHSLEPSAAQTVLKQVYDYYCNNAAGNP